MASEYSRLLLAEWDDDFPDRVLDLLWRCLWPRPLGDDSLDSLLNPRQTARLPEGLFSKIASNIAVGAKFLRTPGLPKPVLHFRPPDEIDRTSWRTYRTIAYLTLQANVPLPTVPGFFLDAQALAFQSAIHVTLPKLNERLSPVRTILLHALALFAAGYFSVDPAHSTYMFSALYGAIGDDKRRLRSLHESFRFTAPEDHSFLTKAQEYCMELLDLDRRRQAEEFLLAVAQRSLPEHQDEIRAMMADAFGHPAALAH